VQYKNTNSCRRNLLNVKSHIKKIGFDLAAGTLEVYVSVAAVANETRAVASLGGEPGGRRPPGDTIQRVRP